MIPKSGGETQAGGFLEALCAERLTRGLAHLGALSGACDVEAEWGDMVPAVRAGSAASCVEVVIRTKTSLAAEHVRGGSKGGGSTPRQSANVIHRVCWLTGISRVRRNPPGRLRRLRFGAPNGPLGRARAPRRIWECADDERRAPDGNERPAAAGSKRDPLGPAYRQAEGPARTSAAFNMGDPLARIPVERPCRRLHARNGEQPFLKRSTLRESPVVR